MKWRLSLLVTITVCTKVIIPSNSHAQPDSVVDCFPLSLGNSWTYHFYHEFHINYSMGGFYGRLDTGIVQYQIEGKLDAPDSVTWTFSEKRHLQRRIVDTPRGLLFDSSIVDTNVFDVVELKSADHQLYRQLSDEGALWNSVYPFQPGLPDTARIYRYLPVGQDLTNSVFLWYQSFYIGYWVTLKKDIGLTRLQGNSYVTGEARESVDHQLLSQTILGVRTNAGLHIPATIYLAPNYPNPFNPTTTIRFGIIRKSHVKLDVFNVLGQLVASLVNAERDPGLHQVQFDGTGLSSGIYIIRLEADGFLDTKRMALIR